MPITRMIQHFRAVGVCLLVAAAMSTLYVAQAFSQAAPNTVHRSLRVISEHLIPGRWAEVRGPSDKELRATTVLEFSIDEVSSKVRNGPPLDEQSDFGWPVWAGVLPLEIRAQAPIPDEQLADDVVVPDYVRHYDARAIGRASHSDR
jgi:hypothetical protein